MGRFSGRDYSPSDDSSSNWQGLDIANVVLEVAKRPDGSLGCPCGCFGVPTTKKATFITGHDATLKGKLIRAHLTGAKITIVHDTFTHRPASAMEIAEGYGWAVYLIDARARVDREQKPRTLTALGRTVSIKVGRWDYGGTVVAIRTLQDGNLVWDVEYETKQGKTQHQTVPAEA